MRLPAVGRESARLFSAPVRPQIIDGQPYLVLDMGVNGRLTRTPEPGVQSLYGQSANLDARYLTSYVRDISLVTNKQYEHLRPPLAVRHFPADLANQDLEYSGTYEDGWTSGDSYFLLAGGAAAQFVLHVG